MNYNNQLIAYRESVVKYSYAHTVKAASIRFNQAERTIYYWRRMYNGNKKSLAPKSTRPHKHPAQHTEAEIQKIKNSIRRSPHDGLVVRWIKLRERGYTRSLSGLYRALQRIGFIPTKPQNPKYVAKPYEQMLYPGQRVQIDVKYVPGSCLTEKGKKYYQFTAIDEYSRFRYLKAYEEHSTYSAADFLHEVVRRFPFKIECVQTDNGSEFTKWKQDPTKHNPTLFESTLQKLGIKHKKIRPYTPRHNGKVERSHRKDNEWFYAHHRFYSFADLQNQLARWCAEYNNIPMRPLSYRSPREVLKNYQAEQQKNLLKSCKGY